MVEFFFASASVYCYPRLWACYPRVSVLDTANVPRMSRSCDTSGPKTKTHPTDAPVHVWDLDLRFLLECVRRVSCDDAVKTMWRSLCNKHGVCNKRIRNIKTGCYGYGSSKMLYLKGAQNVARPMLRVRNLHFSRLERCEVQPRP